MADGKESESRPGTRVSARQQGRRGTQQAEPNTNAEVEQAPEPSVEPPLPAPEPPSAAAALLWAPDQLGFGASNPFLNRPRVPGPRVEPRRLSKAEAAQARLEASLRSSIVAADSRAGIGQGGALAVSLRSAFSESSLLRDTVELVAQIDQQGRLLSLTGTGSNAREIARATEQARADLKAKKFHIPKGAAGLRVRLRVTVGVKLPSGREPKYAVSVFGIPLTKGAGGQSPSLQFFPELFASEPAPSAPDRSSPLPPPGTLRVLRMQVDPSDLGTAGRRFVLASVLSEEPL